MAASSLPASPPPLPKHPARDLLSRIEATVASVDSNGLSASAQVGLDLGPEQPALHLTRWHYRHQLHQLWKLELDASSTTPLMDADSLLWQSACFWQRDGSLGFHPLTGRIETLTAIGSSADLFHYRLTIVPALQRLAYVRRERVFQRCTALDVAERLLQEHGIYPVEVRQAPELARWRHLSQHRDPTDSTLFESDLHFLRRILAAEGLSLWLEADEAGEHVVIGRAGLSAQAAKPLPLPLATPSGLTAPAESAEHLFDFSHIRQRAPNVARVRAYNYRDNGRVLAVDFEADPHAPLNAAGEPTVWEEEAHGADALLFEGNHTSGVQSWLEAQARVLGQRHNQSRETLKASSNAAGLWRCGQTVELALAQPGLAQLWLLTGIEAGSHVSPWLESLPDDPPLTPGAAHVHFEASPLNRWVSQGWVPDALPSARLDLEHARIGSTGGAYAYLDNHGRYQLEINADQNLDQAAQGGTSRPARHIRKHAGPDHGWHLPLHEATEVLVAYHGGHPDTPLIAGAVHNSSQPDLVTGVNASRNVLRTWANNKFRLEDRQGQEHIKLSTEYGLSQLNLGHHVDAKRVPRGEGWEIRTAQWGAVRAAQGLLVTTFGGQPRGALGSGAGSTVQGYAEAHQLYNPGSQDAQGAQAFAEQRGEANEQVGLGALDGLKASRQIIDRTADFQAPILHFASAEHLMLLTPGSQQFSADAMSFMAQGSVELSSADQIRMYAKGGITWHTEGADRAGAGQGGARADIISQGSDEVQVFKGKASILAGRDVVFEFRGEKAFFGVQGASFELTQAGELTINASTEFISEAASHLLGGALDWRAGSGSVSGASAGHGSSAADKKKDGKARFQIGSLTGLANGPYPNEPYKLYRNGGLHASGITDDRGVIAVDHLDGTSQYKVELASGQQFELASSDQFATDYAIVEQQTLSAWGHRAIDGLDHQVQTGRKLFNLI